MSEAQGELFPIRVVVTRVDPRTVLGANTRVKALWHVRWPDDPRPHVVYHDRHGWYCEEHGPTCRAVARARDADERASLPDEPDLFGA